MGTLTGVLAFLAFMTKQSDLLAVLPVLVVLLMIASIGAARGRRLARQVRTAVGAAPTANALRAVVALRAQNAELEKELAADRHDHDLLIDALAACARQLSDFKVPRAVYLVRALPRSTLSKVNKAELRKVAHTGADRSAAEAQWLSAADSDPSGDAR